MRTVSHSSIPEIAHTPDRNSFVRCSSEKDILSMNHNHNRHNHNINNQRIPAQYARSRDPPTTKTDKTRRPTSYPRAADGIPVDDQFRHQSTPSERPASVTGCLKVPAGGQSRKPGAQYHAPEDNSISASTPDYYVTADNVRHHVRQCSTDTYLHLNDVAMDTATTTTTPLNESTPPQASATRTKISAGSYEGPGTEEGSGNEKHAHAHTMAEVRHKLEESLREETLLRRRRNSLNLELDLMKGKLEELREDNATCTATHNHSNNDNNNNNNKDNNINNNNNKDNNNNNNNKETNSGNNTLTKRDRTTSTKDTTPTCNLSAADRSIRIEILEKRTAGIEQELKSIDKRICTTTATTAYDHNNVTLPSSGHGTVEKKRKTSIMKRLRAGKMKDPGSLIHTCSMSVESLTSTVSHDSSVGRESPYESSVASATSDRLSYVQTMSSVDESTDGDCSNGGSVKNIGVGGPKKCGSPVTQGGSPVYGTSPGRLNGLETLLRTTQLLENGEFPTHKRDSSASSSCVGDILTSSSGASKRECTTSPDVADAGPMSVRSKSMSAVDTVSTSKSATKVDETPLNSNSVDVIIEVRITHILILWNVYCIILLILP